MYKVHHTVKPIIDSLTKEFVENLNAVLNEPVKVKISIFQTKVTEEFIRSVVCHHFRLRWDEVTFKSRETDKVIARQIYAVLMSKYVTDNPGTIGKKINRERTSVMYLLETAIIRENTNDEKYMKYYTPILKEIQNFINDTQKN